jgi:hypothetical protein
MALPNAQTTAESLADPKDFRFEEETQGAEMHEVEEGKDAMEAVIDENVSAAVSPPPSAVHDLSPAELIAKGRAPVKKEFIRLPSARVSSDPDHASTGATSDVAVAAADYEAASTVDPAIEAKASKISAVKKSKRQQKRERKQVSIASAFIVKHDISCRSRHLNSLFLWFLSENL